MDLTEVGHKAEVTLRRNSPAILTAMGVGGTVMTSYLAAKASFEAARAIASVESETGTAEDPIERGKERARYVWRLYIPATVSGVVTITCIIGGAKMGMKRTAAAYSLLTISEKAFGEYKEKVAEKFGEKKEQEVRDEIAEDRVRESFANKQVLVVGSGAVMCYEMHTGRYFQSDIESLRKAQNYINQKILSQMEASLDDFYYELNLPSTSNSHMFGWDTGRMLELEFSTVLSPDEKPCIAFDYNHLKLLYDRH